MKGIKRSLKEKIAVLRLKQGDTEAFGYLYDLYSERIYRYVMFRVSDQGTAHDIMQEVFLQTWEYIVSDRQVRDIKSFVYRVAYNRVADHFRAKGRQALLIDEVPEGDIGRSEHDSTKLEMHFLKKHIQELKPDHQDVIVLRYVEGMSVREVADIMERDTNNIRVMIHRAIGVLKSKYSESQESKKRESKNRE